MSFPTGVKTGFSLVKSSSKLLASRFDLWIREREGGREGRGGGGRVGKES